MRKAVKILLWTVGSIAVLLILVVIASFALTGPMTRFAEREMNKHLKGYVITMDKVQPNIFYLSLMIDNAKIIQEAHPDPPIAEVPLFMADLQWREMLRGHVVGRVLFYHPRLHINLIQLRSYAKAKEKPSGKDWQEALKSIFPFDINRFEVDTGDLVYIDQDPKKPLRLENLRIEADNIRNIRDPEKEYPSPFHAAATVLGYGKATLDGDANFLEEPHFGTRSVFKITDMPLERFRPVLERNNVVLRSGTLSAAGLVEYAPGKELVRLYEVVLNDFKADYIHAPATKKQEKTVKEVAKAQSNKPNVLLRLDKFSIVNGELGLVDEARSPSYKIFIDKLNLTVTNFSNHFSEGVAEARLTGLFVGSGRTTVTAAFRPETQGPNFDMKIAVEKAKLADMNSLLGSYANFTVERGLFSFFMELHVKDNLVTGYAKPFFKDMKVKEEGPLFRVLYQKLVGLLAGILKNPKGQVATNAPIFGNLKSGVKTSTWQIIVKAIQNAFFEAILPGFREKLPKPEAPPEPETNTPAEKATSFEPPRAKATARQSGFDLRSARETNAPFGRPIWISTGS